MANPLPPLPRTFIITMDHRDPEMAALMDLYTCACGHDFEDHGPTGAAPGSKSKCSKCGCGRYLFQDEVP